MFGGLGKSNVDQQRSILALLNDDRLTPAQKSAYCFDQGICEGCGVKTHWVGPFKRRPYTNERVWNGICRSCHPEKCADSKSAANPAATQWDKVLLAQTSQAFSSLQSSVSSGIKDINGAVNSEKARAFRSETSKAFGSVTSSVTEGINSLNDNIKKNTDNMDMSGTSRAFNNLQSSVTEGFNSMKTKTMQPKKKKSNSLCGLKNNFKTNSQELKMNSKSADELALQEGDQIESNPLDASPACLKGKLVKTAFGKGRVIDYRHEDEIFVIDLQHNTKEEDTTEAKTNNPKLYCKRESFEVERESKKSRQKQSMELNEAYESLEKMRRLNLEVQCQERGIFGPIDYNKCTICLLNPDQDKSNQQQPQNFHRIRKLMQDSKKKAATPCLFCAAPTCPDQHSCPAFKKEGITACLDCVKLFESEYMVACINQAHGLSADKTIEENAASDAAMEAQPLEHMMDLYDRVLLLLQYSSQYIESIAAALEEQTKRGNNVNIGASSVGIVSGALGVAAAAAIFTPAGAPLLVASLMLGGGATAAQTGTEVVNYFSEPNKFADKIIALIGMVHSLLRVKETLREILTARLMAEQGNPEVDRLKNSLNNLRKKQRAAAVKAGTTVASTAVLGGVAIGAEVAAGAAGVAAVESAALVSSAEVGVIASRNVNMMSKSGTAIARGARFARFAGGALSAATILLEARTMHNTIEQIKQGHPCEKANALRTILKEIPTLPTTEQLDEEIRIYIGAMSNRVNANSLEDAINLIESKAIQEYQQTKAQVQGSDGELAPEGVSILDGDDEDEDQSAWESVTGALSASLQMSTTDADSVATPPVPRTIQAGPVVASSQSNLNPTNSSSPAAVRMTQSMYALPSDGSAGSASPSSSALFERIKKFKQKESFGSTGSNGPAPPAQTTPTTNGNGIV